ncbi:MAG TPA: 5-oxoprolinase subunit PxpB [Verrucomicrobiae bacterium]|nr:5-oxoprolinase subunit PxpB [Verrucomicrobiae bacterium]
MTTWPRVLPYGESAYLVELGDTLDEGLAERARALADRWKYGPAVPAYASVVLQYGASHDPALADTRVARLLRTEGAQAAARRPPRLIDIPTRYDGADLAEVAAMSKVSVDELVKLHTGREYTAFFLGFLPGWAYCGRLDPRIKAPRLESPRPRIAAGTVAVADGQTGVYPFPSPGGWRLIGTTDVAMFDPAREQPALLEAGDRVRFVAR